MEKPIQSENERCDKLMEKYNFDSPIKVTLIIEEEGPPEPVLLKSLLVSNNKNELNTNAFEQKSEVYKGTDSNKDNATNTIFKNYKSKSVSEENDQVSKTVFPEGHQKQTQDIQWQLLDSVADNLIHITKCYYNSFINYKKQTTDIEKLKLEYLTFKHYFFDLSYSTTIAILLPQETNILFLNNFIHRIIKIANRSSWFQISYKMLDKLIRDMFIWTKRKKTNLDLKFGSHVQGGMDCSSSELTNSDGLINKSKQSSVKIGPITNHASQGSYIQQDIVSKTHLPVQVISISPNIRHITSFSTQELTSPFDVSFKTNYSMPDAENPTSSCHIKNNSELKRPKQSHSNCLESSHSQPLINDLPSFEQRTNHETSSPMTVDRRMNGATQEITSMPYKGSRIFHSKKTISSTYDIVPKKKYFSSRQALNTNTRKILVSVGPPNQEVTISVDSEILANINHQNTKQLNNNPIDYHVNEAYGVKSFKRRKTIDSYSNSLPHHNDNNCHYNKNNSSTTNLKLRDEPCYDDSRRAGYELFNTDTLRSSISRDSGCDSPNNGSFRNEQMIETPDNEKQESPVISHVTSMNPNAVRLNIGFCKVCGSTTNNICIGCYQEYYCSFLCQTKGWENHKYLCSGSQ